MPRATSAMMKTEAQSTTIQEEDSDDDKPLDELLRAAQIEVDDKDSGQHALTLRMWAIGTIFAIVGCGLNTLFTLRSPSISIAASTAQLLAYPAGRLWDKAVPSRTFTVVGRSFSLNPHPFNTKEHCLIYIMVNITFFTRMTADLLVEQKNFFGLDSGWGYQLLMILSLFLIGFAFAGLTRSVLVEPRKIIWPGVLSATALMSVLHNRKMPGEDSDDSSRPASDSQRPWRLSGFAFFCLVFAISFCWYWLPDFIFPALSYFSYVCWMKPDSTIINQVFGVSSGIGLLPLTFDWSQVAYVAYVASPLLVPSWAIINIAVALVVWVYIVAPACYYSNVWNTAYLPFQSSSIFDNTGNVYNVSRIISDGSFDVDVSEYESYSPVYMPTTYALNTFALAIATLASLISWTALEHRKSIMTVIRDMTRLRPFSTRDAQPKEPSTTGDVPAWWYLISLALGLTLAIFAIEYWSIELRWYGVLLGFAVGGVFFFPITLLYANANMKVGIEVFCRIIAGFVWEGRVVANTWFVGLGYTTILDGLSFAQDMKLCLYYHIPPLEVFLVQCTGMLIGTIGQVGIVNWALDNIKNICTSDAINGFTCPFSQTNFNTSIIWGGIGPRRFFSTESGYRSLFYLLIIGGLLPVIVHILKRKYPRSFWKNVSVPLLLGGLNYIPPATGMNYGSWAIVGLFFGVFMRRRHNGWWRRYNFILSSSLESSVSFGGMIIFFAVYYSGVSGRLKWWGTEVYKDTCDWKGCPYLPIPASGKFE
ncbi:OPT superfamily oligopeptide transporter [Aspergillus keveii]|uniref:OPT superfamily oligopeptide transporter n=1 Tax=Aspergillus keveii TaxID=714993 RepID=A0ABR4FZW1_9EURO